MAQDIITIDGAEGGGQILRTAVALSALGQRPIRVVNIRGARPKPGLQPQHLLAVRAVSDLCSADIRGAEKGSTEIEFHPGPLSPKRDLHLDVGTAGSLTLLLQSLLPCLAMAGGESRLALRGGTNVPFSPPVEYMDQVLVPALRQMGVHVTVSLKKRGFYPKGGGELLVTVKARPPLQPTVRMERGELRGISGVVYSAQLPSHVADRIAKSATARFSEAGHTVSLQRDESTPSIGPGCGIALFADYEGGVMGADALGAPKKRSEEVGREAADRLLSEMATGAAVDSHLADQLIIWAALAQGPSRYLAPRVTDHIRSAAAVTEQVLGARFTISGEGPAAIECEGRGH